MTREITTHAINPANEALKVHAIDGPGPGGASHLYHVGTEIGDQPALNAHMRAHPLLPLVIGFQNGPVKEDGNGVNGVTHEALLAIIADRLRAFQSGPYKNAWNERALERINNAIWCLHQRTIEREKRGVEGTHTV